MMWRSTIFLLIAILHLTTSASLCGSSNEIPIHNNVPPMTTNSPFSILTSVSTAHQSEIVTLRIKSILSELKFEGFIVHAFSTTRGEILGRFRSSREGLKLNNCNSDDNIAIYQAYPEGTYEAELQWQAPNDYVGEILFNATIVQDFNTFWVDVTSNPLKVVQDEESIVKSFLSSPAVRSRQNVLSKAYPNTPIYEGCGSTKTCFGFPFNCEQERSCQAIATATINDDNRFIFELQSLIADAAYIALGLSRSHLMGNCSVMECVREDGSVKQYNSWNLRRSNHRVDVPQNITRLLDSSTIDGSIYCKFEREPYSIVLENEFDLQAEDFYFLIAMGTTFSATAIGSHNRGRNATQGPLEIIREVDPIYRGCGTTKACFGMPIGCLNVSSCDAVGAVLVRDEEYEIELQSEDIRAAYVSFGLSEDEYMGDDSVIECVVENGVVRSYASWNTPQPNLGNTRQGLVQQDIITHIDSSYSDGKIYCKVRREKATVILGHEFNMAWQDFHFMLATGTGFTANSINRHDLGRLASVDAFVLPGRRSDAPYVRISAIAIVTWLLATSIGQFFRGL